MISRIKQFEFTYHSNQGPALYHEVIVMMHRYLCMVAEPGKMILSFPGEKLILPAEIRMGQTATEINLNVRLALQSEKRVPDVWRFIDASEVRGYISQVIHQISLAE